MAIHGWIWLEWQDMAGNGDKGLEKTQHGLNGCEWLYRVVNGLKWL